jgi:TolB-like protein/DNA-binding winged helix-turn-helix (wHTH) protein/Flp pilus assembly protein TadD
MSLHTVRFGTFELNPQTDELRKNGLRVKIEGQPLRLLRLLIDRPGDLITGAEIQQVLWADGTVVDFEHSIKTAVKKLRQVLGDEASNPRFIETVPRRGYRFIAPVQSTQKIAESPDQTLGPAASNGSAIQTEHPKEKPSFRAVAEGTSGWSFRRWRVLSVMAMGIALVGVLLYLFIHHLSESERHGEVFRVNALVVLPLDNLSGQKEEEYFADGITEQLITDLGKLNDLRIISRTSSVQYRHTRKTLSQIARELNVDAIVEGTVLRSGDRVRVNVQLIHVPIERQLWAESYDRNERDMLQMQSDIARSIANEIDARSASKKQLNLPAQRPLNPMAYEAYLRGRYFWNKRSEEGLKKSIKFFEEAIQIAAEFAPAYSGLADAHEQLVLNDMEPPREHMETALKMARKALDLDPTLAEAHTSLAAVHLYYDWQFEEARAEFARAIDLNPGYSIAHWWYGLCLLSIGDYASARKELERAESQDPLSVPILTDHGFVLTQSRQAAQGVRKIQEAIELDPGSAFSLQVLGFALRSAGRLEEAVAASEKAHSIAPANQLALGLLGSVYAFAGRRTAALQVLRELDELSAHRYVSAYSRVLVYIALGEKDQAFQWLDRAVDERSPRIAYLRSNLTFDPLRSDPRFDALRKKTGI